MNKPVLALAIGAALLATFAVEKSDMPIGVRLNNPLNIRYNSANDWRGQIGQESGFVKFDTAQNGYRAAAIILQNYAKRGIKTLSQIIGTWTPKQGFADGVSYTNPTDAYIAKVSKMTGFAPSDTITKDMYAALFNAMTFFELGMVPYTQSVIDSGVRSAFA